MKLLITAILILNFSALAKDLILGDGAGTNPTHKIEDILGAPEKFEGKTVEVSGEITDVCPMKGCWIDLKSNGQKIHVKVEDDVIVFPKDSKGKVAQVKGKVVAKKLSHKQAIKYYEHRAEELGKPFDPKSVKGPTTIFQIEGSGARIAQ